MSKTHIMFASSPTPSMAAGFAAEAAALIKAKMEVDINIDPRKPIDLGTLVAACRGLELSFQARAQHGLPDGTPITLYAVFGRDGEKPAVYLGNEVRCGDGRIVAQRIRSPEAAVAFREASTHEARHDKASNLFLANWRDEGVLDRETAKRLVVLAFPSDMTAGVAYRVSWYAKEHMLDAGRVDLRPAMPALCAALDESDAKAAAAKALVADGAATKLTADELRDQAKALGIKGVSKLRKAELIAALSGTPVPEHHDVTPEQMKAINVAINLAGANLDGEILLKRALREAGIRVPVVQGGGAGSYRAALLAAAKACVVAEPVGA